MPEDDDELARLRARVESLEAQLNALDRPELGQGLSEREALLRHAEHIAEIGSWMWDPSTGSVLWSDECYRILGYDPATQKPSAEAFFGALHPEDRERVMAGSAAVAAGEPSSDDARVVHADGAIRHVRLASATVPHPTGGPPRIVGTVLDVTSRLAASQSLRETAATLAEAQRIGNIGSWSWCPSTGQMRWSAQTFRILGLEPETQAASTDVFASTIHEDDRERMVAHMRSAVTGDNDLGDVSFRIRWPDGAVRHLVLTVALSDAEDEVPTLVGILSDQTERKQLESQLLHAQKMDAIGTLAGGLAHEFNNYLMVTQGNAELLRLEIDEDGPAGEFLREIREATERCHVLTQRILGFARSTERRPRSFDLNEMARSAEGMLRRLLGGAIGIRYLGASNRMWVEADPVEIEQVLVNLVVNARDAMPDGGTIELSLTESDPPRRPRLASREVSRFYRLRVADQGTGIDEATLPSIFDPFFTTKPEREGTGLGLSTVWTIVEQSGGTVVVNTERDRGTEFDVYLPVADPVEPPEAAEPNDEEIRGRILLAEDELQVRRLVGRHLREAGFGVDIVENGQEAWTRFEATPDRWDLVLSDLRMPLLSGLELARRISSASPHTPVLLMTGYSSDPSAEFPLLRKPFRRDALLDAVTVALQAKAKSSPGVG